MELDIQQIIQGGAVGISVALIFLLAYGMKIAYKLFSNHIEHNTKAVEDNAKSNQELRATVNELCIYLKALNGNARINKTVDK
jgi:hypothetical protein